MCRLAAADADRCAEPNTRTRAGPDLDQELVARRLNRIPRTFRSQVQSGESQERVKTRGRLQGGNRLCGQRRDTERQWGDLEAPMGGGGVTVAPMGGGGLTVAPIRHRSGGESSVTTAGSSVPPVTCPCGCPAPPRSRP